MAESKLDDWFVAKYLIHDGETVEEAKARLKAERCGRKQYIRRQQKSVVQKA